MNKLVVYRTATMKGRPVLRTSCIQSLLNIGPKSRRSALPYDQLLNPPSIFSVAPVQNAPASLARKSAALPMSTGLPSSSRLDLAFTVSRSSGCASEKGVSMTACEQAGYATAFQPHPTSAQGNRRFPAAKRPPLSSLKSERGRRPGPNMVCGLQTLGLTSWTDRVNADPVFAVLFRRDRREAAHGELGRCVRADERDTCCQLPPPTPVPPICAYPQDPRWS